MKTCKIYCSTIFISYSYYPTEYLVIVFKNSKYDRDFGVMNMMRKRDLWQHVFNIELFKRFSPT